MGIKMKQVRGTANVAFEEVDLEGKFINPLWVFEGYRKSCFCHISKSSRTSDLV